MYTILPLTPTPVPPDSAQAIRAHAKHLVRSMLADGRAKEREAMHDTLSAVRAWNEDAAKQYRSAHATFVSDAGAFELSGERRGGVGLRHRL